MLFKSIDLSSAQFKTTGNTIEGYASKFGEADLVNDITVKGAFSESLSGRGLPRMFLEHDPKVTIGKWTEAYEDDVGLFVKGELTPGNRTAEETKANIAFGATTGLSIGYRVLESVKTGAVNMLKKLELFEVSIVGTPCLQSAQITSLKSLNMDELDAVASIREFETMLRQYGLSKSQAEALVVKARSLKGLTEQDELNIISQKLGKLLG